MVYDPSTITGVLARFRAADLALSDGAAVASWTDSVGGLVLSQATTAKRPTYRASVAALNNQPAVQFVRTASQELHAAGPTGFLASAATGMIFVVIVPSGTQSGTQCWAFASTGANSSQGRLAVYHNSTDHLGISGRRLDSDSSGTVYAAGVTSVNGTTPEAVTIRGDWSAATATVWRNGTQDATGAWLTSGVTSATAPLGVSIGSTLTGYWINGWVAEVIFCNANLSDADRGKIHSYIQDTYGITVSDYTSGAQALSGTGSISATASVTSTGTPAHKGTGTFAGGTATWTSTHLAGIVRSGSDFAVVSGAAGAMSGVSLEPDNSTPKAGSWVHVSGDFNLVSLMSDPTNPQATFTAPTL